MAEETTTPVETAPNPEAVPEPAPVEAPDAPAAPEPSRKKGGSLLVFLTVLLILVGVTDLVLWGVAGYYLLRSA